MVSVANALKFLHCLVHYRCAKNGPRIRGLKTKVIRKGVLIFRGNRGTPEAVVLPSSPTFFADPKVAQRYGDCYTYSFTRPVTLLDTYDADNLQKLSKLLTGKDLETFQVLTGYGLTHLDPSKYFQIHASCRYQDKPVDEVAICTEGFLTQADFEKHEYVSLKFGKIVCNLGFDGFITKEGQMRARGVEFHPEVLLCNPQDVLRLNDRQVCAEF